MAGDKPKVEGGLLSKPYPIKTRGDVSRARVLPQPKMEAAAPMSATPVAAPKAPAGDRSFDQPQGGFDYIRKRNALMRSNGRSMSGKR